jgi:hypothetical protein
VDLLNDIEKKGTNIIAIKAIKAGDIIDVTGFGATAQKGKVRHISGNKCWVVLERLGFVITLKLL